MSTPAPNFGRGGAAAEEAAKQAGGGKFAKVNYFSLEENKTAVLRFLTDSPDWLYVKQHPSVPTKNKPADFKGNWPPSMPAICRHDGAFAGIYTDCYVCDTPIMNPRDNTKPLKPAVRVWALAVEREPVVENGVTKGYRSVIEEIPVRDEKGEETGKVIRQPKIVVVNMGMKNFFSGLQGIFGLFGTVCDRDYLIRRTGTGLDTDYQIIPLDKIESVQPGTPAWEKFEKAIEENGLDLAKIVADKASDEYYARFFDPTKTVASSGGTADASPAEQAAAAPTPQAQEPVVDQDRLAAMRDRVRGTGGNAAPAAEAPAAAPAAPAAEVPAQASEPAPTADASQFD